jgi:hypothetical protein
MGYYAAGGSIPQFSSASLASHTVASSSSAANATPPEDRPRRRTQVINLTALRRAERRVARFTKLAHRMVAFHKTHKLKARRRGRR